MKLRLSGEWVYAEECVRVAGAWRATSRWERIGGEWVLTRDASTWAQQELDWEADHYWEGVTLN